jgi:hypothetical protein
MKIARWTMSSTTARAAVRDTGVAIAMAGSTTGHRSVSGQGSAYG